jgi:hypothetical protein
MLPPIQFKYNVSIDGRSCEKKSCSVVFIVGMVVVLWERFYDFMENLPLIEGEEYYYEMLHATVLSPYAIQVVYGGVVALYISWLGCVSLRNYAKSV